MSKKLINCKSCGHEISRKAKKCPNCGADPRNFFIKHKFISIILIIGLLAGVGTVIESNRKSKLTYIPYSYGDIIVEENTIKGSTFKLPEGVNISIDKQHIVSKEEINKVNIFNDAVNDVSILEITIDNKGEKSFSYNSLGLSYATKKGIQIDGLSIQFNVLPKEFEKFDSFGSGELMPGNKFTRIVEIEIPDEDSIGQFYWDYFDSKFSVELP